MLPTLHNTTRNRNPVNELMIGLRFRSCRTGWLDLGKVALERNARGTRTTTTRTEQINCAEKPPGWNAVEVRRLRRLPSQTRAEPLKVLISPKRNGFLLTCSGDFGLQSWNIRAHVFPVRSCKMVRTGILQDVVLRVEIAIPAVEFCKLHRVWSCKEVL